MSEGYHKDDQTQVRDVDVHVVDFDKFDDHGK